MQQPKWREIDVLFFRREKKNWGDSAGIWNKNKEPQQTIKNDSASEGVTWRFTYQQESQM